MKEGLLYFAVFSNTLALAFVLISEALDVRGLIRHYSLKIQKTMNQSFEELVAIVDGIAVTNQKIKTEVTGLKENLAIALEQLATAEQGLTGDQAFQLRGRLLGVKASADEVDALIPDAVVETPVEPTPDPIVPEPPVIEAE